jgi:hypothetical protein
VELPTPHDTPPHLITPSPTFAHSSTFEGTVLNIATQGKIRFFKNPNSKGGDPSVNFPVIDGASGIENILFLEGGEPPPRPKGPNAGIALVYATFWIEKVMHARRPSFFQLQYAQMVIMDFPIFTALPAVINLGWPHISVATLRRDFS